MARAGQRGHVATDAGDRVVGCYEAFLQEFPTAKACAAASSSDGRALVVGTGLQPRALHLHGAASGDRARARGQPPDNERALRALAGVVRTRHGPFCPLPSNSMWPPSIPTWCGCWRAVSQGGTDYRPGPGVWPNRLLPAGRSWEFNQAMFDLGATVCTAARPACDACPLRSQCRWRRRGLSAPDPWRISPSVRPQSPFAGSDRQGRGRLVHALRPGRGVAGDAGRGLRMAG